jgi:hypothetical protein
MQIAAGAGREEMGTTMNRSINSYDIFFTRENGTEGKDRFDAASEAGAISDFYDAYRHATFTNVKVVCMVTDWNKSRQIISDKFGFRFETIILWNAHYFDTTKRGDNSEYFDFCVCGVHYLALRAAESGQYKLRITSPMICGYAIAG